MENLLEQVKALDLRMVMEDLGFSIVQSRRLRCPFHEDDSPSLVVYPPPQNEFHCFGCNRHGDVINFYADVNQISFKTALERLAFTYIPGYENPDLKAFKPTTPPTQSPRQPPTTTYVYRPKHAEIYTNFRNFCLNYPPTTSTRQAADYLAERGLSHWAIRHFGLFFIKNYAAANAYLKEQYSEADLRECGLMNEKGNLIFYVHPIIFPYFENGEIRYLQGRTIGSPKDRASKYQFLRGVPRPMFNADILPTLRTGSEIYLTEGAIDCMTLFQNGIPAVSLGSASHFRPEWGKQFRRFEVIVWFDNDPAGQQGTAELVEKLHLNGISVRTKKLPDGVKDINEYYQKLNS